MRTRGLRPSLLPALCLLLLVGLFAGCMESGPQKTLNATAKALTDKNSQNFLAQFDMDAFASHELVNLKQNNNILNFAGEVGALFGVANEMDEWLRDAMDLKTQYTRTFSRTVSSGELVAQCTTSTTADCPWDPEALKKAEIKERGPESAIAKVTTKANMTSWIALHKKGENWYIVGKAVLEEEAAKFADNRQPLLEMPQDKRLPGPVAPKTPDRESSGSEAQAI